ncbi:MAG TPA: chemotaxis protein [Campylobacterales bacterium]|nr:chemotaxis protein [Campylobacterales bacterium]
MTQEELDAMMAGGLDEDIAVLEEEEIAEIEDSTYEEDCIDCPPPPTKEYKVVSQLDDVTKDSEVKAGEIFDKLEDISAFVGDTEELSNTLTQTLTDNIQMFEKLCAKFPNVESFKTALAENQEALSKTEEITQKSQDSSDEIMMIMDIMQYQDIHRQKIERVINVMRALSKYMSALFESSMDDDKRASTAQHISGDSYDEVTEDEIEALLESLGKK